MKDLHCVPTFADWAKAVELPQWMRLYSLLCCQSRADAALSIPRVDRKQFNNTPPVLETSSGVERVINVKTIVV